MYDLKLLISRALEARKWSYAPYSHFHVGAALLCKDGTVYTGSNMENAAFSPSLCAERVAFAKAVSEAHAVCGEAQPHAEDYDWRSHFKAIAITGAAAESRKTDFCTPCGVCRQVMAEFCGPDFVVVCARTDDDGNILEMKQWRLEDLLPEGFSL